jgi:hypothetical protein
MALNLVILVIIPIVLAVVIVSPFEDEPIEIVSPQETSNFAILFFTLLVIWILILARTIYLTRYARKVSTKS